MIFDAHLHFVPQEIGEYTSFYKGVWNDKQRLYDFLDQEDICQALIVYPSTDAHLKLASMAQVCEKYNQSLKQIIKENKKIVAAGIVDLSSFTTLKEQVTRLADDGFSAISLASSQDGKFLVKELYPLYQVAQEKKLAIFVHPQTINPVGFDRVKDPLLMPVLEYSFESSLFLGLLMMQGILEEYSINWIFSSLAGVIPFLKDRFDRVYTMLRGRNLVKDLGKVPSQILKSVYLDTSGASLGNIKMAIEMFGEDKILWGSDYPVSGNVKENLSMLNELGGKVKEKIITKNFLGIFKEQNESIS